MAINPDDLRNQLKNLTKSFGPAQLATIGLLGVIALFAAMWFMRWASAPTYSVLFSGLDQADTAQVVEELEGQGIAYEIGGDGNTVLVPADAVHRVRLDLSAKGLPSGGTVGYEIFEKQGITTSEFRQRVDYQRALQGELTRTLLAIKGVQAASVNLSIPQDRLFEDDKEPTRASVLLRTSGTLGDEAVQSIVHLVAASVPGLEPDGVTVADVNGRVLSAPGNTGSLSSRQLDLTRGYEQQLAADAGTMLDRVFGPGHAVVRVSAALNFDESQQETETYDPTNASPIRESSESETFSGSGSVPGGVLGVDGQPIDTAGDGDTTYERTQTQSEFGVDRVVTRSTVAPGKVERLSVAVVLDSNADPVPDPAKVQSIVAAALGLDQERGDQIVVDQLAFDQTLVEEADAAAGAAASAASQDQLLGYARTGVGALVLLLVAFFLIRGTRRREEEVAVTESTLAQALAAANSPAGALRAGGMVGAPLPAAIGASGEYDNQVLSLIDQQPDEVAQLLRGWLADRRT